MSESHSDSVPAPLTLSSEERAAARSFLQRSEVRLSTLHRVATALLSGAGLVVLLPAIARDALIAVVNALTTGIDPVRIALLVAVMPVLGFPLLALVLLLKELTRFYFHSHHVEGESGAMFTPRFTLTGLRIPRDELGENAHRALEDIRHLDAQIDLVVPPNDAGRASVDRRLIGYGLARGDDRQRAESLHRLVAGMDRDLLTEVAKVEAGMVRHLLRLQVVVLRYVKALGVFVATVLAVFAGAAVVERASDQMASGSDGAALVILGLIVVVWAPVIGVVVASPVRWVEQLLRAEGARSAAVAADPELTRMEQLGMWFSSAGWLAAVSAILLALMGAVPGHDAAPGAPVVSVAIVVMSATGVAQALVVRRWVRRRRIDS